MPANPKPSGTARSILNPRQVLKIAPRLRSETATEADRQSIKANGYDFEVEKIGAKQRTRRITGNLKSGPVERRSRNMQLRAGGEDRQPDDDGGHFIAGRFNGPRKAFNHFAQNARFNRGVYREVENGWAKELAAGRRVFVDIIPHYRGSSIRPDSLTIVWTVDGELHERDFSNSK